MKTDSVDFLEHYNAATDFLAELKYEEESAWAKVGKAGTALHQDPALRAQVAQVHALLAIAEAINDLRESRS